jgi:hypothetical protein
LITQTICATWDICIRPIDAAVASRIAFESVSLLAVLTVRHNEHERWIYERRRIGCAANAYTREDM